MESLPSSFSLPRRLSSLHGDDIPLKTDPFELRAALEEFFDRLALVRSSSHPPNPNDNDDDENNNNNSDDDDDN